MKKKRHTPILKGKEIQPNQVKAIIILISTSTNKHMHNAQCEVSRQKEQRMPKATLWSYHPYLMKALNRQNNQMVINPLQSRLITLNEEDPPHRNQEDSSNFRH